jgi:hypothetical protein
MATVYIYGASDDLLCFSGNISDETYPRDKFGILVSDGTYIKGYYDGDWNLYVDVEGSGNLIITRFKKGSSEAEKYSGRDYSDVIMVQGDFDWLAPVDKIFKVCK